MLVFCSICKERFIPSAEICVPKCGHLYHEHCLRRWQERSQSCPQCRTKIKDKPIRVYFTTEDAEVNIPSQTDIDSLKVEIYRLNETVMDLRNRNIELENSNEKSKVRIAQYEDMDKINKSRIRVLEEDLVKLNNKLLKFSALEKENEMLRCKLTTKSNLDTVLQGTVEEVNEMVSKTPITPLAVKQLCIYVEALKMETKKLKEQCQSGILTSEFLPRYGRKKLEHDQIYPKTAKNQISQWKRNTTRDAESGIEAVKINPLKRSIDDVQGSLAGSRNEEGNSKKILTPVDQSESHKKNTKLQKRVINNLDVAKKTESCSDSSDIDIKIYSRPGRSKLFTNHINQQKGIFYKLKANFQK